MLMQTVSLYDTLDICRSDVPVFICDGCVQPEPEKNLAWQAYMAVCSKTGIDLKARIELKKQIPSAAGLGGGSSDCAGVLMALNKLYDLGLSRNELDGLAISLGADVPFFLEGGLCRVRGIGEQVEKLNCSFAYPLLIVHCGNGLSTPEVYKQYDVISNGRNAKPAMSTDEIFNSLRSGSLQCLNKLELNQLEAASASMMPDIDQVKRRMYENGALFSQMSGSGSAVYAVFETKEAAYKAAVEFSGSYVCETLL